MSIGGTRPSSIQAHPDTISSDAVQRAETPDTETAAPEYKILGASGRCPHSPVARGLQGPIHME